MPDDHPVHAVIELVAAMDTSRFHRLARLGGVGRRGYDPDMMLVVLMLGLASGVRSSRALERLCGTDTAFMYACGLDAPDHTSLARFRKVHEEAFEEAFTDGLAFLADHGMIHTNVVSIDGTKIPADASIDANRDQDWVRARARQILAEVDAVDAREDAVFGPARGDQPDPVMRDRDSRRAAARAWLAEADAAKAAAQAKAQQSQAQAACREQQIAEGSLPRGRHAGDVHARQRQAEASWQHQRQAQQAKVDAYQKAKDDGAVAKGRAPTPADEFAKVIRARKVYEKARDAAAAAVADTSADDDGQGDRAKIGTSRVQVNTTDPQSRLMKTRKGWVQGYNVQVAVSSDHVILVCQVGQATNDVTSFVPILDKTRQVVRGLDKVGGVPRRIGVVLADAGYNSDTNLTTPGPDRLIAQGKGRDQARRELADRPPDPDATPAAAMQHRLDTQTGKDLYKKRGATVEPTIGNLKKLIDRMSRRGIPACQAEMHLAALTYNLLKLHRHTHPTAA